MGGLLLARQRRKHEQEADFLRRRATAVEGLWGALAHAQRALLLPADIQGWIPENQREFDEAADSFRRKFLDARLYLPARVEKKLEEYWGVMKEAGWITKSRAHPGQDRDWWERYGKATARLRSLREELDTEGRKLLGDPEAK